MTAAGTPEPTRPTTAIDAIAEEWVTTVADLDPDIAVWIGIPGRHGEYADLSPAGHSRLVTAAKKVIAQIDATEAADDVDVVTRTDLLAKLRVEVEATEAGLWKR
ncbi:MAG: DUF885 domain-containing protein, partial [Actinomycetales bacterium]|nr:DUF885 domain-containing protein [Actinomycetales bacterium]